jgi:hypothetical protein
MQRSQILKFKSNRLRSNPHSGDSSFLKLATDAFERLQQVALWWAAFSFTCECEMPIMARPGKIP